MAPPPASSSRDARSTTADHGNAVPYHSKWLIVKYFESTPYPSDNGEPEHYETISVFLPEYIVRQVSHYGLKLDEELAKPDYNENTPITIEDDHKHDKLIYNYAIQFLASGFFPKLTGDESSCKETLNNLSLLDEFSVYMEIKTLELAVTKHIDDFKSLTLPVFLDFARNYYANDENNHDSKDDSLALLIKNKLANFMPQIIRRKMVQEIQKDGKLGEQLVDVLADFYSGHKKAVKRKARKALDISDGEQEPVKEELDEDSW